MLNTSLIVFELGCQYYFCTPSYLKELSSIETMITPESRNWASSRLTHTRLASKLTSLYLIFAALATRYRNWKSFRRIYLSLLTEGHPSDASSELAFNYALNFEAVKFGSPKVSIASFVLASNSYFCWRYWDVSLLGVYLIRAICLFLILYTL